MVMPDALYLLYLLLYTQFVTGTSRQFEPFSFNRHEIQNYRDEVRDLFYFAYDSYLEHGYPYDEVRPISCEAKTRNFDDADDLMTNDVLGNFTTTLIDSLTTLAILGDKNRFSKALELVDEAIPMDFAIDSTIQVFETTIRIVGGLISAHLYATDPTKQVYLGPSYDGNLLQRAKNLADRLLPAYLTQTGLPVPRINLKNTFYNIHYALVSENNAAASASPMLEFTMLSYLTHDEKYQDVAGYAFNKTWELRSSLNLVPMSFNPDTAEIYHPITGIGASVDSFYEYALKGSILFDDNHLYDVWLQAYYALNIYAKGEWFYYNVHTSTGDTISPWIDSLSAFFPGLQVLDGELEEAKYKHIMSLKLWNTYGGIPERWMFTTPQVGDQCNTPSASIQLEWYPLRPEFVESTYFLYRATHDVFYLNIGRSILQDLKKRFKANCGFAGIQNVLTGEPQDRMESFVLGETLKYLYLLFDEENELHLQRNHNQIFSTEAHPMWLTAEMKSAYRKNRYFNDSIYMAHLNELRSEGLGKQREIEPSLHDKFMGLFKYSSSDDSGQVETCADEENNLDPVRYKNGDKSAPVTCPNHLSGQNSLQFYSSSMLNAFPRLFEIDQRYSTTLIRPKWMEGVVPVEITPGFYSRWYNPATARSQLESKCAIFEFILDDKRQRTLPIKPIFRNNRYYLPSLRGSKLRIQRISPGVVDTYGDYISPSLFEQLAAKTSTSEDCAQYGVPTELLFLTGVDGQRFPKGSTFVVDYNELFGPHAKHLEDSLSRNSQNQLILNCLVLSNVYVE